MFTFETFKKNRKKSSKKTKVINNNRKAQPIRNIIHEVGLKANNNNSYNPELFNFFFFHRFNSNYQ